jgi:hypothetical protein
MDDLTYTLRALCKRNRDGSHATQADRLRILTLASHGASAAFISAYARGISYAYAGPLQVGCPPLRRPSPKAHGYQTAAHAGQVT